MAYYNDLTLGYNGPATGTWRMSYSRRLGLLLFYLSITRQCCVATTNMSYALCYASPCTILCDACEPTRPKKCPTPCPPPKEKCPISSPKDIIIHQKVKYGPDFVPCCMRKYALPCSAHEDCLV
uniref:Uncharacterized protein n=1 Tax=Trichogramma kaykai TaxID=54128 RepID=A0ABD2XCY6_9HYME